MEQDLQREWFATDMKDARVEGKPRGTLIRPTPRRIARHKTGHHEASFAEEHTSLRGGGSILNTMRCIESGPCIKNRKEIAAAS